MGSGDIFTQKVLVYQKGASTQANVQAKMRHAISKYWHLVDRFVHKFSIKLVKSVRIPVYWGNPFSVRD